MTAAVLLEIAEGAAWLTLNRPDVYNAVDRQTLAQLADLLERLGQDQSVRCVVLSGAGKAFCSGADLSVDPCESDESEFRRMMDVTGRVITLLTTLPVPVIAAVNGPAAGVGASIAFASDLVIAARGAYFLLPFTGVGLIPDGGATRTVAASIGRTRALRLALRRERLGAQEAFDAGLVAAVCAPEELTALATQWAAELVAGPRLAIARCKSVINDHTIGNLDDVLARESHEQVQLLGSADFAEGVTAFVERREPVFGD